MVVASNSVCFHAATEGKGYALGATSGLPSSGTNSESVITFKNCPRIDSEGINEGSGRTHEVSNGDLILGKASEALSPKLGINRRRMKTRGRRYTDRHAPG